MEGWYGAFERVIPMPVSVDSEKINAEYKKGCPGDPFTQETGGQTEANPHYGQVGGGVEHDGGDGFIPLSLSYDGV